jgi:hypothetical protein
MMISKATSKGCFQEILWVLDFLADIGEPKENHIIGYVLVQKHTKSVSKP